jgi:hypothetical protein
MMATSSSYPTSDTLTGYIGIAVKIEERVKKRGIEANRE